MVGETVTVTHPAATATDEYGDPIPGQSATVQVPGCAVAPRMQLQASTESGERGRQGVIVGLTVYTPPGVDIRSSDKLTVRGVDYDVEGEPGVWVNAFTGVPRGVEVALRRAVG